MNQENHFSHMLPLVIFTFLAAGGAGLMIGASGLMLTGAPVPVLDEFILTAFLSVSLGTVVSLLHLGRKARFMRAMLGFGHSWLSREVVTAGMFAGLAGLSYVSYNGMIELPKGLLLPVTLAAAAAGVLLTLTIGMVYHLRARKTWKGPANWCAPFFSACLLGTYIFFYFEPVPGIRVLFLTAWTVDFVFALLRASVFQRMRGNVHCFYFPSLISVTGILYVCRMLLSPVLLGLSFYLPGYGVMLLITLTAGLDRFTFYSGMAAFSPGSETAVLKAERMKEALGCSITKEE